MNRRKRKNFNLFTWRSQKWGLRNKENSFYTFRQGKIHFVRNRQDKENLGCAYIFSE